MVKCFQRQQNSNFNFIKVVVPFFYYALNFIKKILIIKKIPSVNIKYKILK